MKMKDEWSLKGRLVYYVINKEDGRKGHIEEKDFDSKKWEKIFSLYSRGDIEILRQKLIEDLEKRRNVLKGKIESFLLDYMTTDSKYKYSIDDLMRTILPFIHEEFMKLEEAINKRFGIEEEGGDSNEVG